MCRAVTGRGFYVIPVMLMGCQDMRLEVWGDESHDGYPSPLAAASALD
jgi:hypothetical protein